MTATKSQVRIVVPESLAVYVPTAVARIGYLYPHLTIGHEGTELVLTGADAQSVAQTRRDCLYALYREKIYAETLPTRQALIREITGG